MEVACRLFIGFDEEEEAIIFYRSLAPDFKEFNISVQDKVVRVEIEGLRPSRARAILNSILRIAQLNEEIRNLLT